MTTDALTVSTLGFLENAITSVEGVQRLAEVIAKCGTMPAHLQGKPQDCFRIVVQAAKWRMDPFAVAECTALVHGRLCYEGKLVAAVLQAMNAIEGRLDYAIEGTGQAARIVVSGTPKGAKKAVSVSGSVREWRTHTKKDGKEIPNAWDNMPETMLVYRGTRQWARMFTPEAILGVYTPDEFEGQTIDVSGTVTVHADASPSQPPKPAELTPEEKVAKEEANRLYAELLKIHRGIAVVCWEAGATWFEKTKNLTDARARLKALDEELGQDACDDWVDEITGGAGYSKTMEKGARLDRGACQGALARLFAAPAKQAGTAAEAKTEAPTKLTDQEQPPF